jgi:hypothetical protein
MFRNAVTAAKNKTNKARGFRVLAEGEELSVNIDEVSVRCWSLGYRRLRALWTRKSSPSTKRGAENRVRLVAKEAKARPMRRRG